jgi:hypothetical protein
VSRTTHEAGSLAHTCSKLKLVTHFDPMTSAAVYDLKQVLSEVEPVGLSRQS